MVETGRPSRVRNMAALTILLVGIGLLASMPTGEAHGGGITVSSGQASDNLFRYFISRGITLDSEYDTEFQAPDVWRNPPTGCTNAAGIRFGDYGNQCQPHIQARFRALATLTDGDTASDAGTGVLMMRHNATVGAPDQSSNETALTVHFPQTVYANNSKGVITKQTGGGAGGTNPINVSIVFMLDSTIVRYQNVSQVACNAVASDMSHAVSFERIGFNKALIQIDDSACGAIVGSDQVQFGLKQWAVYSTHASDVNNWTDPALEYGDWLVRARTSSETSTFGNNLTGIADNATIVLAPGMNYVYTTASCPNSNDACLSSTSSPVWVGCYIQTIPSQECATPTSDLEINYAGTAIDDSTRTKRIDIWRINNPTNGFSAVGLGGDSDSGATYQAFDSINSVFANDYNTNIPSRAVCYECFRSQASGGDPFQTVAIAYPAAGGSARGPFQTLSVDSSLINGANFDMNNVTAVGSIAGCASTVTNCSISISVPAYQYYGNALYVVLGAYNATSVPTLCDDSTNATINGNVVPLGWTRSGADFSGSGLGFLRLCAWLLTDFAVSRQASFDGSAYGHSPIAFDNSKALTYTFNLTTDKWHALARAPNGPASNGYSLRTPQVFAGFHAERIACSSTYVLCYGNHNTFGVPGGTSTQYKIHTQAQGQNSNITNAEIFESRTAYSTFTNATGNATFTLPGTNDPSFVVSKAGFRTVYVNLSDVNVQFLNLTVSMVSVFDNRIYTGIECTPQGETVQCDTYQTNNSGDPNICNPNLQTGCSINPQSINIEFSCALRGTSAEWVFSTVSESSLSYSQSLPPGGETNLTACNTLRVGETGVASLLGVSKSGADNLRFSWVRTGYRTLNFSADWLDNFTEIILVPRIQPGTGFATSVIVEVSNATLGGVSHSYIVIRDSGAPGADNTAGARSLSAGLVGLACGLAMCDEAGKAFFGILLVIVIWVTVFLLWYRTFKRAPPLVVNSFLIVGGFFGFAFMGFFPAWLVFLIAAGIVAAVLLAGRGFT